MESCWLLLFWGCTWQVAIGAKHSNDLKALNKYLRYGFIENLDTVRHIPVGKFWGIKLSVTPITWLSPIVFFALGVIVGTFESRMNLTQTLYHTGVFVIGVEISTLMNALGHILGGKHVRTPMDELLLTATRGVNIYHGDQAAIPGFVHLGRAMGGPILNLLIYGVM